MSSAKFDIDSLGKLTPNGAGAITITYTTTGGKATITAFSPKNYAGPLEIPSTLGGSPVTSISTNVFYGCVNLTSITIPASVTSIGQNAFISCSKLATVTFASNSQLQTIGIAAFNDCVELTSIAIPDSVTSIATDAFSSCLKLNSVTFSSFSQLTTIGDNAFSNCTALTSITIPNSVTTIANNAFTSSALTNVNVSVGFLQLKGLNAGSNQTFYGKSGVTIVGYKLFNSTGQLTGARFQLNGATLVIIESYSSIGANAFGNATSLTSITIPASVTSIDQNAFIGCTSLTSITFASGSQLLTIGQHAFHTCTGLTSITIPASVTSIGYGAFVGCTGLTSVTFASGSQLLTIGGSAFDNCTKLTSITIPSLVTSISYGAFSRCSSLTSISVDSSNQKFSSVDGVLYNTLIKTLILYPSGKSGSTFSILASVTTIGQEAFHTCTGLTSITIPDSVTTIGEYAFYFCSGLTSITIPDSVTSIGNGAFQGSGLTTMYVSRTNKLALIPSSTPVIEYGTTFTVKDVAAAVPICFPAGTKVTTDQGDIAIEKLQPKVNTIRGKKIVGITQTIPLQKHIISIEKDALAKNVPSVTTQISKEHKVFYKGKMVKARDLVEVCQGVTAIPYNGEILYNVLLKKHDKMMVNNLICETLDPENIVAKIYNGNFQPTEKSKICEKLNHIIRTNNIPEYKKLYASLK
jgi:hypothetical protein